MRHSSTHGVVLQQAARWQSLQQPLDFCVDCCSASEAAAVAAWTQTHRRCLMCSFAERNHA